MATRTNPSLDPRRIFDGVSAKDPVVLAISGGSDSMALLLLASAWSNHTGVELQAVTVDHGLRPEAAAEAAFVAGTCEALRVPHVTLAWEGLKPSSGLPEASRFARYQLLEEFASDIGASQILAAHTSDDQAETIYMRMQRNVPGGTGLGDCGMAVKTTLPKGLTLVRPLLPFSRKALRQYLTDRSQSWVEDPSNLDMAYERVRVRQKLADNEAFKDKILRYGSAVGRLRRVIARDVAAFLSESLVTNPGLVYELDLGKFLELPTTIQIQAMRIVIAIAGGGERLVSTVKIASLLDWIEASSVSSKAARLTIGNCVISKRGNKLMVFREQRNLKPLLLSSHDTAIWDGRFAISNDSSSGLYVGPLEKGLLFELEAIHAKKFDVTPRAALLSLPVLRFDNDETIVPFLKCGRIPKSASIVPVSRPIEHYSTQFDAPLRAWFLEWKKTVLDMLPARY